MTLQLGVCSGRPRSLYMEIYVNFTEFKVYTVGYSSANTDSTTVVRCGVTINGHQ